MKFSKIGEKHEYLIKEYGAFNKRAHLHACKFHIELAFIQHFWGWFN